MSYKNHLPKGSYLLPGEKWMIGLSWATALIGLGLWHKAERAHNHDRQPVQPFKPLIEQAAPVPQSMFPETSDTSYVGDYRFILRKTGYRDYHKYTRLHPHLGDLLQSDTAFVKIGSEKIVESVSNSFYLRRLKDGTDASVHEYLGRDMDAYLGRSAASPDSSPKDVFRRDVAIVINSRPVDAPYPTSLADGAESHIPSGEGRSAPVTSADKALYSKHVKELLNNFSTRKQDTIPAQKVLPQ